MELWNFYIYLAIFKLLHTFSELFGLGGTLKVTKGHLSLDPAGPNSIQPGFNWVGHPQPLWEPQIIHFNLFQARKKNYNCAQTEPHSISLIFPICRYYYCSSLPLLCPFTLNSLLVFLFVFFLEGGRFTISLCSPHRISVAGCAFLQLPRAHPSDPQHSPRGPAAPFISSPGLCR